MNNVDLADKNKMFTMPEYTGTRGHPLKIYKRRFRLNIRENYFSNKVIDAWKELAENVVMSPTLNSFKSRLNKFWYGHPHKFDPWYYIPGERPRHRPTYRNTSVEAREPNQTLTT